MSMLWGRAMTSLGSLFSPLGTSANIKQMFERCIKARTKKEEAWLIEDCLKLVESQLKDPTTTPTIITRGLAFVIFADMLGFRNDFAQIYAVKLAQFGSLSEKRLGYLSCIFLIKASDPLAVMVMNTILRDLCSKNILVVAMAISASCYLIPANLTSSVLPLLAEKLTHPSDFLRSKAVIAFHHFLRVYPEHCCNYLNAVYTVLSDKDPCVVGYVLQFLLDVTEENDTQLTNSIPHLINIQQQILEGKLSDTYNYRGVSAPWMQMTIMRLFQYSNESVYSEISDISHKTWKKLKLGQRFPLQEALKMECLKVLIHSEGGNQNLNMAMEYVEELLSGSPNLRYTGLDLLQIIIEHYNIVLKYELQQVVLTCLEETDVTLKHKALRLLCVTANEMNVDEICSQVVESIRFYSGINKYLQAELIKQAIVLIDKFPNTENYWHVAMLIRLLPLADNTQIISIQRRIKAILSSDNQQNVIHARQKVIQILRKYSASKTVSISILDMFVWMLSHFGMSYQENKEINHSENCVQEILKLGKKILKHHVTVRSLPPEIEKLLVSINNALTYIIDKYGVVHKDINQYIEEVKLMTVNNSYLHKYCLKILKSLPHTEELHSCLKDVDTYQEIEGFDLTLSFLDWYVSDSLRGGENLYHTNYSRIVQMSTTESVFNSNYHLYRGVESTRGPSDTCTSIVTPEELSLGPLTTEELKFDFDQSAGIETTGSKVVWTKAGRVNDYVKHTVPEECSLEVSKISHDNSYHSFECDKKIDEEQKLGNNQDALEKLLNQDFQK